jgi:hypothetical protein
VGNAIVLPALRIVYDWIPAFAGMTTLIMENLGLFDSDPFVPNSH